MTAKRKTKAQREQPHEMKPAPNEMTPDQAYGRMFDRYEGALKGMAKPPYGVAGAGLGMVPGSVEFLRSAYGLQAEQPHTVVGSEMERTTQGVMVPRRVIEEVIEVMECNDPLQPVIGKLRALLGQREG